MKKTKLTKSDKQWIDAYFLGFTAGRKVELKKLNRKIKSFNVQEKKELLEWEK